MTGQLREGRSAEEMHHLKFTSHSVIVWVLEASDDGGGANLTGYPVLGRDVVQIRVRLYNYVGDHDFWNVFVW